MRSTGGVQFIKFLKNHLNFVENIKKGAAEESIKELMQKIS